MYNSNLKNPFYPNGLNFHGRTATKVSNFIYAKKKDMVYAKDSQNQKQLTSF